MQDKRASALEYYILWGIPRVTVTVKNWNFYDNLLVPEASLPDNFFD
jgi:hypothetical protein